MCRYAAACRDTAQSWEDAAVKKIKKKAGIATAPAVKYYPSAPKFSANAASPAAAAPAPAAAASAPVAAAPAPVASTGDAKADARAAMEAKIAERKVGLAVQVVNAAAP